MIWNTAAVSADPGGVYKGSTADKLTSCWPTSGELVVTFQVSLFVQRVYQHRPCTVGVKFRVTSARVGARKREPQSLFLLAGKMKFQKTELRTEGCQGLHVGSWDSYPS